MKISVIVPFLDEAVALPATLACIASARTPAADVEIIAVDGGSRDDSVAVLHRHEVSRVLRAPRGRAAQMNAGAAAATGDLLLFLHADTSLPTDAFAAIAAAARSGAVWGGFTHRFSGTDRRLAMISALHNFRCRQALTFYGDQAMFVAREAFVRVGGFPMVVAEDIALSKRLRKVAPPVILAQAVMTSARKFEQMGVWRSLARVVAILVCMRLGRPLPQAFFANIR